MLTCAATEHEAPQEEVLAGAALYGTRSRKRQLAASRDVKDPWASVAIRLGGKFVNDVNRAVVGNTKPVGRAGYLRAALVLSLWMTEENADEERVAAVNIYSARSGPKRSEADIQRMCVLYGRFYDYVRASGAWCPVSAFHLARQGALVLQWLGELEDALYPRYLRRFHVARVPVSGAPSVGTLQWPELEGLTGIDRERRGLSLVAEAAYGEFDHMEKVFDFGQSTITKDAAPLNVDSDCWLEVHRCLIGARESWSTGKTRSRRFANSLVKECSAITKSSGTWVSAGLPQQCADRIWEGSAKLSSIKLGYLAMQCLASSRQSAAAVCAIFCCHTGWNKESALDMPVEPVVFRAGARVGVASAQYLASFKNSASHLVVARLEEGQPFPEPLLPDLLSDWERIGSAINPSVDATGHAILDVDGGARVLNVINRFRRMAEASRALHPLCRVSKRLLIFPPPLSGAGTVDGLEASSYLTLSAMDNELMHRPGLSFDAIRKSVLLAQHNRLGTVTAVVPIAGQRGYAVLMRHYLKTADFKAELDAAMVFYLNAFQAVMLAEKSGAAAALGIPHQDLEWFGRLAAASGMSAALGALPTSTRPVQTTFCFHPTEANLQELFLVHWALRRAANEIPAMKWRVRCLPLLAAVKAIGSIVCAKGLRKVYLAAARAAHRSLVAGDTALPPVGGV